MAVGDFARAFQAAAHRAGIPLRPGTGVPWLSGWGHQDPGVRTAPAEVLERLAFAHGQLGGNAGALGMKRRRRPGLDFWLGDNIAVELDELQHFTRYRLQTLDYYHGLRHGVDLPAYRLWCQRHQAQANRAFAHKTATDFAFPGGRAAQRAYLDLARDLLGPVFGCRVLRVPAAEGDVGTAVNRLQGLLEPSS